jgi:hypothetical protein
MSDRGIEIVAQSELALRQVFRSPHIRSRWFGCVATLGAYRIWCSRDTPFSEGAPR